MRRPPKVPRPSLHYISRIRSARDAVSVRIRRHGHAADSAETGETGESVNADELVLVEVYSPSSWRSVNSERDDAFASDKQKFGGLVVETHSSPVSLLEELSDPENATAGPSSHDSRAEEEEEKEENIVEVIARHVSVSMAAALPQLPEQRAEQQLPVQVAEFVPVQVVEQRPAKQAAEAGPSGSTLPVECVAVPPRAAASASWEPVPMMAPDKWEQPDRPLNLRGPNYLEDKIKVPAEAPMCTLFAAQGVDHLEGEHVPGASATLLERGALVPPESARFVLSVHFMNPRSSAKPMPRGVNASYKSLMMHFSSDVCAADSPGASGELIRELWEGDAANALSRCKVLVNLVNGPHLVRAVLAWLSLDESRPMLICRQVNANLNRATISTISLPGRDAGACAALEHVEISIDCANSPLCRQVFHYAFPALETVEVALSLVLEGRAEDELPERPLCSFAVSHLDPEASFEPQPAAWPADASEVPGENTHCTWQSTRAHLSGAATDKRGHRRKWTR